MATKLLLVVATRPQFVKLAALWPAIEGEDGIDVTAVDTGQHWERALTEGLLDGLHVPKPLLSLGIGDLPRDELVGRTTEALCRCLAEGGFDAVLVLGDTNGTYAGALAAARAGLPLAHLEAGTRSGNWRMLEEANRVVADHLAGLNLCATPGAVRTLEREGIGHTALHVGDVMYDLALRFRSRLADVPGVPRPEEPYAVATLHRAENVDDPDSLAALLEFLGGEAERRPVVLPLHPRLRRALRGDPSRTRLLRLVEPQSYLRMSSLVAAAEEVFTDSGGLQREACFHRVPCTTLREETEWPETIEAGWNRLWRGPSRRPARETDVFGDGQAARAALRALRTWAEDGFVPRPDGAFLRSGRPAERSGSRSRRASRRPRPLAHE